MKTYTFSLTVIGAFVTITAIWANSAPVFQIMANWPHLYLITPLIGGILISKQRPATVSGITAFSTLAVVGLFYATTAVDSPYGVDAWGPIFWSFVAVPGGAFVGLIASVLRPQMLKHVRATYLVFIAALAVLQVYLVQGPSFHSRSELLGASAVIVAFSATLVLAALHVARRTPDSRTEVDDSVALPHDGIVVRSDHDR